MLALAKWLAVRLVNFGFVGVPFDRKLFEQLVTQFCIGLTCLSLVVMVVEDSEWCLLL